MVAAAAAAADGVVVVVGGGEEVGVVGIVIIGVEARALHPMSCA